MVVMYLIDALAAIVDGLRSIQPLSLFRYYMGNDPLRNGLSLADAALLADVAAVFLVAALVAFDRRDLAAWVRTFIQGVQARHGAAAQALRRRTLTLQDGRYLIPHM
jgi:hypothetical protein